MNSKKILGYIFIVIAVVLALATIALIPQLMEILAALKDNSNSYETGYSVGYIAYLIIQISITIILWRVGIRWTKRS
ncbi:hypothetical protein SAMN05421741_106143 [Paenimyroides ummariense]|uniref:Uncharacterized protein n=1 Tax=Paenimyroides ummariense TaxID=913024 RepID=A0A1I4ZNE7_9FLAO|nr:hypothetical protein [Paenimyroides ummariense]SFN51784.1 hypothetical protein SAMN05421741_106143 [Paenimyroides ummariense]